MAITKIEWTDRTWNPITGCSWASPACDHCYARRMSARLAGRFGYPEAPHNFDVTLHPDRLDEPSKWRKPSRVFVVSMGDLFHDEVPYEFQRDIFGVMEHNDKHTFQVLTKRPLNARRFYERFGYWPHNVHFGVTIENDDARKRRAMIALTIPAVRFFSIEPLLSAVDLYGLYPDWVIVGGETGQRARKMYETDVRIIKNYCAKNSIPFFFKGWGTATLAKSHPDYMKIDGQEWKQFPGMEK